MKTSRRAILQAAVVLPAASALPAVANAKPQSDAQDRIMYVCTSCADNYPEECGHYSPSDLRVTPDGSWICINCHDDARDGDFGMVAHDDDGLPNWHDLPKPPTYGPVG